MQFLFKIYQRLTWLSLDVVLGSMAGMLFFERALRVELDWQEYALLGMAVWCIYTADHLMDARKLAAEHAEDRRRFHLIYQKPLLLMLGIVGCIGLYWAIKFFGFSQELFFGAGLGVVILGIMFAVRKLAAKQALLKELSSAIFYVIGISWLPWYEAPAIDYTWTAFGLTILYMGLAYLNLIMLSSLDKESDSESGFSSIATLIPQEKLNPRIHQLAIGLMLFALIGLLLVNSLYRIFPGLVLLMLLVHYLSFFKSGSSPEQIRMRMEIAFLIPAILILL
ncbi:hypothetical protein SAMN04489724_3487 [Algoriphagus locisalis]|uniref:UbiA prenyltransferase family protein n=1 Tax=Algoriphagus locisalis TaxID=305507 RepID=A0A1I7CVK9_9BACT|nr:hypothetical protein [Algoriphagus locisalis]SFU03429.1 hypothetical protein SAMN04489724_3487 [Algoriphagus locisalis]